LPDGALLHDLAAPSFCGAAEPKPKVWILLGDRTGDDNQVRALAEALGWPFEAKMMRYNGLRHIPAFRDERLLHLTEETRSGLAPPWPDLVIGLGYESLPVSRFIRRQSGGRTRLVQIGNPRSTIKDIDLVIATPQYCTPNEPNVLRIPFPIGNPARTITPTGEEKAWLASMPEPRRLIAVGGSTRQWKLDRRELERAIQHLKGERDKSGGSVVAVTSRRTPRAIAELLDQLLSGEAEACVHNFPRFAVLLSECGEFHVTADSVSMLAEAMLTGKPVGMIPIQRSTRGRIGHFIRSLGIPLKPKTDLSRFWKFLAENDLAGSVQAPAKPKVEDTTQMAADAVRRLFDQLQRPKVWALLGARTGDNNQVLALAEALGVPFERKQLTYNRWRHLGPHILGATLRSLTPASRASVSGELPDLTISTGHRSVAIVQALRARPNGRMRSIHIGYPRVSPGKFDLVIATPEYPMEDHPNLLRIPLALSRKASRSEGDERFWKAYPSPRRLLVLGGSTLYWRADSQAISKALGQLLAASDAEGGSVIVVGSPRTSEGLLLKVQAMLARGRAPAILIPVGGSPPYAQLVGRADAISVTADSVAMVSEAISTGKPVELVPVTPNSLGRLVMAVMDRVHKRIPPHDLRAFWHAIQDRGLVGGSSNREGVTVPNVIDLAASRSRSVIGWPSRARMVPPDAAGRSSC